MDADGLLADKQDVPDLAVGAPLGQKADYFGLALGQALTVRVEVPPRDREVLASRVRSLSIRAALARRARIVLLAAADRGVQADGDLVEAPVCRRGIGLLGDPPKPGMHALSARES